MLSSLRKSFLGTSQQSSLPSLCESLMTKGSMCPIILSLLPLQKTAIAKIRHSTQDLCSWMWSFCTFLCTYCVCLPSFLLTGRCRLRFALSLAQLRQCGYASEARLKAQQLLKEKFLNWMGFLWLLSLSSRFLGFFGTCVPMSAQTHSSDGLGLPSLGFRMTGPGGSFPLRTPQPPGWRGTRVTELSDPLWAEDFGAALPPRKHPPGIPGGSPWGLGSGGAAVRMAKASSFSMPAISLSCCAKKAAAGSSSPATPFPKGGTASGDAERI